MAQTLLFPVNTQYFEFKMRQFVYEITKLSFLKSTARRFILVSLVLVAVLLSWPLDSVGQIRLAWDPNTEPDVAGYQIYYGTSSRNYRYSVDVGNVTTYTIQGLTQGVTYYIALTAYDSADNESDFSNEVSGSITETVSTPNVINGPTSGTPGQSCAFTAGGSSSSLGHTVDYQFDWKGDGSDLSSWGAATQSKTWNAAGTYNVRARARCVTHKTVISSWFGVFPVTISYGMASLTSQSPSNGASFDSSTLFNKHQPSFEFTPVGVFKKYTLLFSTSPTDFTTRGVYIAKASISASKTSCPPAITTWKKVMNMSYNDGTIRDIYWKIAGESRDGTICDTEVRRFRIEGSRAATINAPQNGANFSAPPTFEFNSNGNTKFSLEISSQPGFDDSKEIKKFSFTAKDPNAEQVVVRTLTSGQWTAVRNLVGAATGYFRIRAWDAIKRETVSEARAFAVQ
jgi:hypothetical protein